MEPSNLRKAIFESGFKHFEVANKAKIHPATLSHLVNGHYPPTSEHKKRIAQALSCHAEELFPENVEATHA